MDSITVTGSATSDPLIGSAYQDPLRRIRATGSAKTGSAKLKIHTGSARSPGSATQDPLSHCQIVHRIRSQDPQGAAKKLTGSAAEATGSAQPLPNSPQLPLRKLAGLYNGSNLRDPDSRGGGIPPTVRDSWRLPNLWPPYTAL